MQFRTSVIATLLVVACSDPRTATRDPAVARYEVSEGDTLRIRGLAADGTTVGELTLRYGHFFSEELERDAYGTMIDFDIHGVQANHRSDGRAQLRLPAIGPDDVASFLLDDRLTDVLARWNVAMVEQAEDVVADEAAYSACASSGMFAPTTTCGATSCSIYDAPAHPYQNQRRQDVCCGNTGNFAHRACTAANSQTSCGLAGAFGCAVCWTQSFSVYCNVVDGGSYAVTEIDAIEVSYQTELGGFSGGLIGNGDSEVIDVFPQYSERIDFFVSKPSWGTFTIQSLDIPGEEQCAGLSCSSVAHGQQGVSITHDQTGLYVIAFYE